VTIVHELSSLSTVRRIRSRRALFIVWSIMALSLR